MTRTEKKNHHGLFFFFFSPIEELQTMVKTQKFVPKIFKYAASHAWTQKRPNAEKRLENYTKTHKKKS